MDFMSIEFWKMVGTAVLCGGIVGLERQLRGKVAGIRTSILICLGTSLFICLSVVHSDKNVVDTTRVLGQVVTGIGFLGAGVILSKEGMVTGVTSASVIWVLAAIGSMVGFGSYSESVIISVVTVLVLSGIGVLEGKYPSLLTGSHSLNGVFNHRKDKPPE
ncbi:MAG: MgtC/SapB family protein [Planctomycetes bacterium]|nr:MgtC/SapB family protein [Planctomycetota bacterium]